MSAIASQITSLTIVYSTVYPGGDQRRHQSPASLAFVRRIHHWPVNSPHKWPVTRKMFSFDDVIMKNRLSPLSGLNRHMDTVSYRNLRGNSRQSRTPLWRHRWHSFLHLRYLTLMAYKRQIRVYSPWSLASQKREVCTEHGISLSTILRARSWESRRSIGIPSFGYIAAISYV